MLLAPAAAVAVVPITNGPIAFVRGPVGGETIGTANPDGTNLDPRLIAVGPADREVAFAANGMALAFTTTRDGNEEIYVAGVDGSGQRNFSRDPGQDHQPAWAPDDRIAFTSSRAGGSHLFVARHDGNELRQLTSGPWRDEEPSWSPDSRSIVFSSDRDGGLDLYVLDVATLAVRRLTADPAPETQPDWGPDGRIVFVGGAPGAEQLFRIDADGTGLTQLTDGIGAPQSPAWSPDGARVAYVLLNGVYVQDAKPGARRRRSGIADPVSVDWGRQPVATRPRAGTSFTLTPSRRGDAAVKPGKMNMEYRDGSRLRDAVDVPADALALEVRRGTVTLKARVPQSGSDITTIKLSGGRFSVAQANRNARPVVRFLGDRGPACGRAAIAKKKRKKRQKAKVDGKAGVRVNDGYAGPEGTVFTVVRACKDARITVQEGSVKLRRVGRRRLWGDGRKFRTVGRYGSATVRG